jgi:hypothetical protein
MKIFKYLYEISEIHYPEIVDHICNLQDGNFYENINFEEYWGGPVVLIENSHELQIISTAQTSETHPGEWASILETADSFDECRYIADGKYVVIFNATTDAGGTSYYIPRHIADTCPNLAKSIELTEVAWGS